MEYQNYYKKWAKTDRKNNQLVLYNLKINGCSICGYNKCMKSLHFHHVVEKNKKFNITAQNMPLKNFFDEMQKCVLLCANCHYEIHTEEKNARN
jgi:ribonuclease HIII